MDAVIRSSSASSIPVRFLVGDRVDVLNPIRLPKVEQVIATGTVQRITESPSGETLYWTDCRLCAVTARQLRLVQRAR